MSKVEKPELLLSGKWGYGGMEFGSEEAATLFIKSREGLLERSSALGQGSLRRWWLAPVVIGGCVVLGVALNSGKTESQARPTPGISASKPMALSAGQLDAFALLINANGQLCATPLSATKLADGRYMVDCKKMRDPLDDATIVHMVNLESGRVE